MMKKIILCAIAVFAMINVYAQTNTDSYYRSHPAWIGMMDQESVNYAEAVKAFNLFWENKETPLEENELFSATEEQKADKAFFAEVKTQSDEAKKYALAYKKFKYWQNDVAAFVKDDGYLMSKEEQLAFWKLQHQGRK